MDGDGGPGRSGLAALIARKVAVALLVGGPLITLSYAGLLMWAADEPFAEALPAGVAFAVVWLGARGVVGLWRLRRDPERFRRTGVMGVFGLQSVPSRRDADRP